MTGTVISISSGKGGVGKTTTSINLASAIQMATQHSTVVVDLDLAMANVLDFLDLEFNPKTDNSLHDVLAGNASIDEAIYEGPGDIHVVPSGPDLEGYAATNPEGINSAIQTLKESFDTVILDTPGGVSYESLLPIGLADFVLLVSSPRLASVRDTEKTKKLAERLNTSVIGVVFVKADSGNAPEVNRIASYLGVECLGQVPDDKSIPNAQDAGKPVLPHEFASKASKAYWDIAKQLIRKTKQMDADSEHEHQSTVASDLLESQDIS